MTAEKILNMKKAGDLYSNDIIRCREEYKELAKVWHPDMNSEDTSDVFAMINKLYGEAQELFSKEMWEKEGCIWFTSNTGKKIQISPLMERSFELGRFYVCNNHIIYLFNEDKEKYFKNAVEKIEGLRFADIRMEKEFSCAVPSIHTKGRLKSGEYFLVIKKEENEYPLSCILEFFKGKVPDRHVAWITSRLCNIACYLKYSDLVHNGISVENCFISPKRHSIRLAGGWWYTVAPGMKMLGTTKEIFNIMPVAAKTAKTADLATDMESIKLLLRRLLGEENCRRLSLDTSIPKAFVDFVTSGSGDNAFEEMEKWDETLKKSYGKRKFIKLVVDKNQIYKIKGGN